MIPYDIDPSLHATEPEQLRLDDGCSSPRSHGESPEPAAAERVSSLERALASKSEF